MMEREHIVAAVVAAGGGELIGRVRLQKTLYLLDRLGLNSEFGFDYHHYGPYSAELDSATADAKAFGLLEEEFRSRQGDGARYSVFRLKQGAENEIPDGAFGKLGREETARLVRKFAETNVTVLELAATAYWLSQVEGYADWRSEIVRRKNVKVQGDRLDRAIQLLNWLGLKLPEAATA